MKTTFKIVKENDEYQIRVFEDGEQNHNRTYFTDDQDDAIETFKAMVEENKVTPGKILPEDNLETALYNANLSDNVIKAILKGYEGTGLSRPICEPDNFHVTDLLHKVIMFFDLHLSWHESLPAEHYVKAKVQKVLDVARDGSIKYTNLKDITKSLRVHRDRGVEIIRVIGYNTEQEGGRKTIADIYEFTLISKYEDSPSCFRKDNQLRAYIQRLITTNMKMEEIEWYELEVANYEGRH